MYVEHISGLAYTIDDAVKMKLKERAGAKEEKEVNAMEFGAIWKSLCLVSLLCSYISRAS